MESLILTNQDLSFNLELTTDIIGTNDNFLIVDVKPFQGDIPAGLTLNKGYAYSMSDIKTYCTTNKLGLKTWTSTGGYTTVIAAPTVTISTSSPLTPGVISVAYTASLAVTGSSSGQYYLVSGSLPVGFSLTQLGVIAGTTTTAATYTFTIGYKDKFTVTTKAFTLVIAGS